MGQSNKFSRADQAAADYAVTRDFDQVMRRYDIRRDSLIVLLRRRGLMPLFGNQAETAPAKPKPRINAGSGAATLANLHITPLDREPCWRCGVRGDIGCIHNRHAA